MRRETYVRKTLTMKKTFPVKILFLMMVVMFSSCKSASVVVTPELEAENVVLSDVKAKKPTIMIVPSDAYCARNGYVSEWVDENGNPYQKGVSMIEIDINPESESYGIPTVQFQFEGDLK